MARVVSVGSTAPVEVVEEEEEVEDGVRDSAAPAPAAGDSAATDGGDGGCGVDPPPGESSSVETSEVGAGAEAPGSPLPHGVVEAGPLSVVHEGPEGASSAVSTSSVSA